MIVEIEFFGNNGDSHETFTVQVSASTDEATAISAAKTLNGNDGISEVVGFVKTLIGDEDNKGPVYDQFRNQLCKIAFDECGWYDVKVSLGKIIIDEKCINQHIIDDEILLEEFGAVFQYTLVRDDRTMWFWE